MSLEVVDSFTPYYSGRQPLVQRPERRRQLALEKQAVAPAQPAEPAPKQPEEVRR